ncbi:MAG: BREX-4 system phosphatase PglZ [Candidatus Bruticola sp.]
MTIDEAVNLLLSESNSFSSFPCRAVMVSNIEEYCLLLERLKNIPDAQLVEANSLISSSSGDTLPRYENLVNDNDYIENNWLILTGVSEYLRLFINKEIKTRRFADLWLRRLSSSNKGRIIIPLWGCSVQWKDNALNLNRDERKCDHFIDCTDNAADQNLQVVVLAKQQFEKYSELLKSQADRVFLGLRSWYEYWMKPNAKDGKHILITSQINNIQSLSLDGISVKVVKDIYSFVKDKLKGGEALTPHNCPAAAAELLFKQALNGDSLDKAVLYALNCARFEAIDIFKRWNDFTEGQKYLVLLWLQLHSDEQSNAYLVSCALAAQEPNELVSRILRDIFTSRAEHPEWEEESQKLIAALNSFKDETFFTELNSIKDHQFRLMYLKGNTSKEHVYLLHMFGEWMRSLPEQAAGCKNLEEIYPELYYYLAPVPFSSFKDDDYERYIQSYKSYKLSNQLPEDDELYFSEFKIDKYGYRYSLLSKYESDSCCILWIDALGAEWLSLLCYSLKGSKVGTIKIVEIAQAVLPSETQFNKHWKQMQTPYVKFDKLDKLAHKGVIDDPDYYTCVEEQINFVYKNIREKVEELLSKYRRVIITGDHGTSRLAARFFHNREGIPVPDQAKAGSYGRYCCLGNNVKIRANENQIEVESKEGDKYLVFKNYNHFVQSGRAAGGNDDNAIFGEIHGGASPEEALVPVVVFDGNCEPPLSAAWKKNELKFTMKKARPIIEFSRPVVDVQAQVGSSLCECIKKDELGQEWMVTIIEKKAEAPADHMYKLAVIADGKLINIPPLKIKPALGGGEFDLP